MSEKMHTYNFSFMGITREGIPSFSRHVMGLNEQGITQSDIELANKECGLDDGAILIAVSYLGFMSKEEYLND